MGNQMLEVHCIQKLITLGERRLLIREVSVGSLKGRMKSLYSMGKLSQALISGWIMVSVPEFIAFAIIVLECNEIIPIHFIWFSKFVADI